MKVLQQLIKHFWHRGVLSAEQAHYLVEHGFVRALDLDQYAPRQAQAESEEDVRKLPPREIPPAEPRLDELERQEKELTSPAPSKRKGTAAAPRPADLTLEQLGEKLAEILKRRGPWLPALLELAGRSQPCASAEDAAVFLRQLSGETFRPLFLAGLRGNAQLLARLWECVDPEPFHALLADSAVRGPAVRSFQTILRASRAGEWGRAGWVLKVPQVQTVANLLAIRRKLVPAVLWSYERQKNVLGRSMHRPTREPRSWQGLGFGMVLYHNARAWKLKRKPAGFVLSRRPRAAAWREAWTTALALDAQRVIPYCVSVLGSLPGLRGTRPEHCAVPENVVLMCPNDWKI